MNEWAHYEDPKDAIKDVGKYTNGVSKGITLVWLGNDKTLFRKEWLSSKEKVIQAFKTQGFFYDKLTSMKLRAVAFNNLLVFTKEKKNRKTFVHKYYEHPEDFLSIATPYRMEENLPYMREWIGYHFHLGVDYFVLYDNYDSTGNNYDPTKANLVDKSN